MAKVWEDYKHYNQVHAYGNLTARSCQRSVSIEGLENIPKDGAVILAPNHRTALMDPMMVLLISKEKIAFGARSDIFKNPKTARWLRWLRILPIARERNGLSEVAKNFEVFDEIVECLEHDVPFCLFSEGMHRAAIRRSHQAMDKSVEEMHKAEDHESKAEYWRRMEDQINLSMPESIEFYRHKLEVAKEYHEGLKSGKYPREHAYSLTYAKKAVNEAQSNLNMAIKLWGE